MKRLIITLLFAIPFLSGCISVDANLKINNNSTASINLNMTSDSRTLPLEHATIMANIKHFIDNSYKVTDNSSQNKIDISAFKEVKKLRDNDLDLSSLGFVSKHPSGRFIEVKHNFFITLYNIDMIYNLKNQQANLKYVSDLINSSNNPLKPEYLKFADTSVSDPDTKVSMDFLDNIDPAVLKNASDDNKTQKTKDIEVDEDYQLFDISNLNSIFSITLPYFASYDNADKVQGTVYSWIINKDSPSEIKLQYVVYSSFAIWFLIIFGILLLAYFAYRIHRHDTLKRIGNNN